MKEYKGLILLLVLGACIWVLTLLCTFSIENYQKYKKNQEIILKITKNPNLSFICNNEASKSKYFLSSTDYEIVQKKKKLIVIMKKFPFIQRKKLPLYYLFSKRDHTIYFLNDCEIVTVKNKEKIKD